MLEELSSDEWDEWQEFFALEPWGFDVLDSMNAMMACTTARTWGADVKPADFLMGPKLPAREKELEAADLHEQVKRMFGHRDYLKSPRARS